MSDLNKLGMYRGMFSGKDEVDYLPILKQKLIATGFVSKSIKTATAETTYFYRDDSDKVFVYCKRDKLGIETGIILSKDFCVEVLDLYSNDKPYPITFSSHSNKDGCYSPWISKLGYVHQVVLMRDGRYTDDSREAKLEIDHISHHFGLCISEELRPCTSAQNKRNKPNYRGSIQDEFTYDPLRDYSHSLYIPFLYYVSGEIEEEDMRTLREMELKAELTA